MAVLTFCSAKGSPGATTTALLASALWLRQTLLVDADPMGGDIAIRCVDAQGGPLDPLRGLLSLLPVARRAVAPEVVVDHAQVLLGGQLAVLGLSAPEQAAAAGSLWAALAEGLAGNTAYDVVVDAGRVHPTAPHLPLLLRSDAIIWVIRPRVSDVIHTRARIGAMAQRLVRLDGSGPLVGVVALTDVQQRGEAKGAIKEIREAHPHVRDLGIVAWDPKGAAMFDGHPLMRPERTLFVRSGTELVELLDAAIPRAVPAAVSAVEPDASPAAPDEGPARAVRPASAGTPVEPAPAPPTTTHPATSPLATPERATEEPAATPQPPEPPTREPVTTPVTESLTTQSATTEPPEPPELPEAEGVDGGSALPKPVAARRAAGGWQPGEAEPGGARRPSLRERLGGRRTDPRDGGTP